MNKSSTPFGVLLLYYYNKILFFYYIYDYRILVGYRTKSVAISVPKIGK